MIPTPTETRPRRLVGIDLGTTNSALAWTGARGAIHIFDVPQLIAPGEVAALPTLPSFLYFPTAAEQDSGLARLPWDARPPVVAGVWAREQGALVPGRQIASVKSWLANPSVDRTAPLLPWGVEEGPRLSPVDASARILAHLRDAWERQPDDAALEPPAPLAHHAIVLTVPASFDEEARELTVQAAHRAGLDRVILLEEPIAALYAWIATHRRQAVAELSDGALVLVCDVGGGTTDFSLMRVSTPDGEIRFERVAIGDHLLLGGDNLDLALATLVEQKLADGGAPKLSLHQRLMLRRKCSAAKEQLLAADAPDRVRITILGSGRGVVSGGMSADLTRDEAVHALTAGFLPLTRRDEAPAKDRRAGLRELGLPYEPDPAITRHLAAFLARSDHGAAMPAAVLFNGGFFTPAVARQQVLDAIAAWSGQRPAVLENDRPEAAVAIGAAFYARLRQNPEAARRLLIRAGSARTYYVGLHAAEAGASRPAVCVMPRGTQEGTALTVERTFTVTSNQPVAFTLYSSAQRDDALGEIVTSADGHEGEELHRHAPLVTVMRYGKRSRRVPIGVTLRVLFTETGTLELWCEARETEHRWRLAFNLRSAEADPLDVSGQLSDSGQPADGAGAVVGAEAIATAAAAIRQVFAPSGGGPVIAPEALAGELESTLGFGKQAWPLAVIRQLADVLLEVSAGRARGPAYETRWLNLAGFCVRPGFGAATDGWRISELRKIYAAGLAFPKDIQCQVEWLVLWQRAVAGFSAGHQRELAQRVGGQLGLGQKKTLRLNPQVEREGWRLLANLERLDAQQRTKLGDELLGRLRRDSKNRSWLWAIGRFGARSPLYGPLSSTVPPAAAERWIDQLRAKGLTPESAHAIAFIGALTGDPARDIGDAARARAVDALTGAGVPIETVRLLTAIVPPTPLDLAQTFGESLPEGLILD